MLARYFELPFRKDTILKILEHKKNSGNFENFGLLEFSALLDMQGLSTTKLTISIENLQRLPTPSLLQIEKKIYIIWNINKDGIILSDPSNSQFTWSTSTCGPSQAPEDSHARQLARCCRFRVAALHFFAQLGRRAAQRQHVPGEAGHESWLRGRAGLLQPSVARWERLLRLFLRGRLGRGAPGTLDAPARTGLLHLRAPSPLRPPRDPVAATG